MSVNTFFVMLKPDAVSRGLVGEILARFEKKGFKLKKMKMLSHQRDILEIHYQEYQEKSFYSDMIEFLCSGPIVILLMSGNIDTARVITGHKIPSEACAGSIRGDYACSLPQNLIHCSHTAEAAAKEVELWSTVFD